MEVKRQGTRVLLSQVGKKDVEGRKGKFAKVEDEKNGGGRQGPSLSKVIKSLKKRR